MKRGFVAAVVGVAVLAVAGYFGSAYLAMSGLRDAAVSKDRDKLEARVDFPAVREVLKAQLNALMVKKVQTDPDLKGNPFAGLAMMVVPTLIDGAVNAYVTPEGLAAVTQGDKPATPGPESAAPAGPESSPPAKSKVRTRSRYVTMDTFRVSIVDDAKTAGQTPSFVFKRQGLFGWRLSRIDLPADL